MHFMAAPVHLSIAKCIAICKSDDAYLGSRMARPFEGGSANMTLFTDENASVSKAAKPATGKGARGDETADGGKTQRGIQSVEVGGRVLLALAQARAPLAWSDLAA